MIYTGITPIQKMGNIWVKREDLAYWSDLNYPSGSKVRQYLDMAHRSVLKSGFPPCIVGCSANSCQQIYVAAAAKQLNTKGIIYTAKRKIQTSATKYCLSLGAEVVEVKPAYLSYVRKQARDRAIAEKHVIEWDRNKAILDTASQVTDLPDGIKRIIVPTGSGLTAAGILIGIMNSHQAPEIIVIATSKMATKSGIEKMAMSAGNFKYVPGITIIEPVMPYDTPVIARLPDGTPLDPFYAAKAWKYVEPYDLLWPPGLRPISSMPEECQSAFRDWKGPVE